MKKIDLLIDTLEGFKIENKKRESELIASAKSENNGLSPSVDANGRMHSPAKGYVWNGDVYGASVESIVFNSKQASITRRTTGADSVAPSVPL